MWDPLHGEHQDFHSICIKDEVVAPKINAQASTPVLHTPSCELAFSRMKRGGVEVITARCVF